MPGFGKGFIILTICYYVVVAIVSLPFSGLVVTGPLFPFLLMIMMIAITLKVSKIIALFNEDAKTAYPIFLFIGTAGLIYSNKFLYYIIKYIIIDDIVDFWVEMGLDIDTGVDMFEPTDTIGDDGIAQADLGATGTGSECIEQSNLNEGISADNINTAFETNSFVGSFVGGFNAFTHDTFSVDPNFCINSVAGGENITIAGPDNATIMHISADGKIFGADNMQIGSYENDTVTGRRAFYDINHENVFSADKAGNYFDGQGNQIGSCYNHGSVTTFTTTAGQETYAMNLDGSAIMDAKTGEVLGYVHKA